MVVRKRLRSILVPLVLYTASGGIAAFFVFHAHHGQRGLEAKRLYKSQIFTLQAELADLKDEHAAWDRRLALMTNSAIDRDLLEEQARIVLGRVHRNDAVILLDRNGRVR
jgi:cell division protein FtsB